MEWTLLVAHTVVGLALVVAEILSLRYLWRTSHGPKRLPRQGALLVAAVALGTCIAASSLFWPMVFGYPIPLAEGHGRVVGLPFLVAVFDAQGYDYTGPLTLPSAIANAVVWLGVPIIGLVFYSRILARRRVGA